MDEKSQPLPEYTDDAHPDSGNAPIEADREGERLVRHALQEASARNTQLLNDLMVTEEAVSSYHNQQARLSSLREEIKTQGQAVQAVQEDSVAKLKDHKRYRDSVGKKWYYILTKMRDKFQEKAKAGEDAYLSAVKIQAEAEKRQDELQQDLAKLEKEGKDLYPIAKRHGEAHKQIDDLYESIFAGPTPGFPDEDEREATRGERRLEHQRVTDRLKLIVQAQKRLELVRKSISRAQTENNRAIEEIEFSLFNPDRAYIWLERSQRYVEQALKTLSDINGNELESEEILESYRDLERSLNSALRTTADAITSQDQFPARSQLFDIVKLSYEELDRALDSHTKFARFLANGEHSSRQAVRESSRRLEASRQALQEIRQGAFETTVGFGAAAPPYNECCDRTDGFENEALAQCQRLPVPTVDEIQDMPPPPSYDRATAAAAT